MRTNYKIAVLSIVSSTALSLCHVAHADQHLSRKSSQFGSTSSGANEEYKISLSLRTGWNTSYTGLPKTVLTFSNLSPHTLELSLEVPFSSFEVEYKDTAKPNTKWKMLKSDSHPQPNTSAPAGPAAPRLAPSQTYSVISRIPPRSHGDTEYGLVGFSMAAQGYYRITATVNIPNVAELDGPLTSPTVVRTFVLNLRSNSIVIRRTSTGFVAVDAVTGKQSVHP